MAKTAKTRHYNSPRRRQQAEETRRDILAAAQRLFERQGYAATSIAAIAAEAQVATKTVYLAFETKSGLLRALWHRLLRGERDEVPVGEQDWYRELLAEPDPEEQIRRAAEASRNVKVRAGGLLRVIRDAASVDPEVAELWSRIETDFHDNQRGVVASLADKGALRDGLNADRAADILWSLNHPNLYLSLARDRGWSAGEYQAWLEELLRFELLGR